MPAHSYDRFAMAFEQAQSRLFTACGVQVASRLVRLADLPVAVRSWKWATARRSSSCTAAA
jgi:hypothetical protein